MEILIEPEKYQQQEKGGSGGPLKEENGSKFQGLERNKRARHWPSEELEWAGKSKGGEGTAEVQYKSHQVPLSCMRVSVLQQHLNYKPYFQEDTLPLQK